MKYNGMPAGMWMLFKNSFRKAFTGDLGYSLSLSMDRRPTVNEAIRYYEHAMTNPATKKFCRMGGEKKFTDSDIEGMK